MARATLRLEDDDSDAVDILMDSRPQIGLDGIPKTRAQLYAAICVNMIKACEEDINLKDVLARKFGRMKNLGGGPLPLEAYEEVAGYVQRMG